MKNEYEKPEKKEVDWDKVFAVGYLSIFAVGVGVIAGSYSKYLKMSKPMIKTSKPDILDVYDTGVEIATSQIELRLRRLCDAGFVKFVDPNAGTDVEHDAVGKIIQVITRGTK